MFSNLLPEKALRKLTAQRLKVDEENEFELLKGLGRDLPGSMVVKKLSKKEIPPYALQVASEHHKKYFSGFTE
jgi:serine/threonine-protein kinase HipA